MITFHQVKIYAFNENDIVDSLEANYVLGVINKDSFQRYSYTNMKDSNFSKTILYANVKNTVSILGIFFAKCLEIYTL